MNNIDRLITWDMQMLQEPAVEVLDSLDDSFQTISGNLEGNIFSGNPDTYHRVAVMAPSERRKSTIRTQLLRRLMWINTQEKAQRIETDQPPITFVTGDFSMFKAFAYDNHLCSTKTDTLSDQDLWNIAHVKGRFEALAVEFISRPVVHLDEDVLITYWKAANGLSAGVPRGSWDSTQQAAIDNNFHPLAPHRGVEFYAFFPLAPEAFVQQQLAITAKVQSLKDSEQAKQVLRSNGTVDDFRDPTDMVEILSLDGNNQTYARQLEHLFQAMHGFVNHYGDDRLKQQWPDEKSFGLNPDQTYKFMEEQYYPWWIKTLFDYQTVVETTPEQADYYADYINRRTAILTAPPLPATPDEPIHLYHHEAQGQDIILRLHVLERQLVGPQGELLRAGMNDIRNGVGIIKK